MARRLGLSQRRYSSYVNETREPSFNDLLRICEVLGTTPDYVLGARAPDEADGLLRRAGAALAGMSEHERELALAALEGVAQAATRRDGRPRKGRPPRDRKPPVTT